ncbi:DUF5691 domain-containing protein [Limnovirga soli]|uniref:Uncharacterized protein n=1 Tax=Limnovirga soli TaxID=2656915 RepID=A0A8J8FCR0_9BACT|nr:DUF5691 domain-containing protein [Limnovirga soli]NNV55062.1 hypothetical protein [Limnovirga soli]
MQFWDNIINTALLGTDKKQVNAGELCPDLSSIFGDVSSNETLDKEEKFLHIAAIAFNYRQSGITPVLRKEITIKVAQPEELPYCNKQTLQILKEILDEESIPLLKFWLQQCVVNQQLVILDLIPTLLDIGRHHKTLRPFITACCGKRGEWLSEFNPDWNFSVRATAEELWQTGTPDERKKVLQLLRETDPTKAREWLTQSWSTENANSKAELLKQLKINISAEDINWLESLLNEKSQKVKDEILHLLKLIPTSGIILQYWNLLQQSIELKKEKKLLGLSSKTVLQIKLPNVIDESIFKTGIEKLSSQKNISEEEYIIYQLISLTPPNLWQEHFNDTAENVYILFSNNKDLERYLPALGLATGRFKNNEWAILFIKEESKYYQDLLPLLTKDIRIKYLLNKIEAFADSVIQFLSNENEEWSPELTSVIFKHTAKNPYQYNRNFYNEHIHLIPATIIKELEKYAPPEEYNAKMWSNMCEYIIKLIQLKQQILSAFNQ